jgi:ABC-type transport system involved in multi-copper enzyme maturation permease subunit
MVLLPVVDRELRVASRGRAMYRTRFYAVLVMSAIFGWCMLTLAQNLNISQAGMEVLNVLSAWVFVFSLLIGVVATSDSVSREKREGTLGLLFLTDLKGYDVICGKLAANSVNALYALVAVLPILGIPLLMGGVTFGQFCKLSLVLVTTMVLSLAVGIFVSTFNRQERKAMVYTILALAMLTFVLPYLVVALVVSFAPLSDAEWLGVMFSPGFGMIVTLAFAPSKAVLPAGTYWFSVIWQWLISAALVARACAHVSHSWEESGAARKPDRWLLKFRFPSLGRAGALRKRLEKNPFLWLALRDEAGRGRVWFFVLSLFAMWLVATLKFGLRMMVDEIVVVCFMVLVHWPLRIWIVSEASRRFVDERSNNTFEFLLTTPLTERQIIRGQWLSLWHQFAGPMAAVLAWEGFIVLVQHAHPGWQHDSISIGGSPLLSMLFLVLDAVALGWVGLWLGLVCRGRTKAILGSLALVVGIPWGLCGLDYALDWVVVRQFMLSPNSEVPTYIRLWYGLLMNGTAIFWIRSHLPKQLRTLASR